VSNPLFLVAILVVLAYALLSARFERAWISMPMVMVAVGFVLGADGIGLVQVNIHSETVKTTAEITLALMLFHDAVRIDLRALRESIRIPARLLGVGLPLMIVLGTGVAWGMFPAIGLAAAALVATMLAPTDAALGEAVVSDKRVPVSIRQGLNVESGLNDGLSVPIFLVLLAICANPGGFESGALVTELARQIGFGVLGGVLVGGIGGVLFRVGLKRGTIMKPWRQIAILAIALGCFVSAAVLGGSGFIGAFAGGVIFGLTSEARSSEDNSLTEHLGIAFDAASFLMVGAALLPFALEYANWSVVGYAVLSLVALRLVSVVVAMLGTEAKSQTLGFMGWFGPRGLATVVFTVMLVDSGTANAGLIASIAVFGIVLSVFAHGITAPPLVSAYSTWWERISGGEDTVEGEQVHEHRRRNWTIRSR